MIELTWRRVPWTNYKWNLFEPHPVTACGSLLGCAYLKNVLIRQLCALDKRSRDSSSSEEALAVKCSRKKTITACNSWEDTQFMAVKQQEHWDKATHQTQDISIWLYYRTPWNRCWHGAITTGVMVGFFLLTLLQSFTFVLVPCVFLCCQPLKTLNCHLCLKVDVLIKVYRSSTEFVYCEPLALLKVIR